MKTQLDDYINYIKTFPKISVIDLESILEYLQDKGYLNEEWNKFRNDFLDTFLNNNMLTNQEATVAKKEILEHIQCLINDIWTVEIREYPNWDVTANWIKIYNINKYR